MSDLLKLAEAYYAVAADLKRNAEYWLRQAEELSGIADRLCEENMRQTPLQDSASGEPNG